MTDDEDWITEEMDDYFLGSQEEEYIAPNDYSYVDPETGLSPKQQAYLDYKRALELYNSNWVGVPWWARKEDPPRWEDFWQEPPYGRPYQPAYLPKRPISKRDRLEKWGVVALVLFYVGGLIGFLVYLLWD